MPSPDPLALLAAAADVLDHAHAPYSAFPVGAAVVAEDGSIITGCNVENASFGLTNCAERTAVFSAVRDGHKRLIAVAITCREKAMPYPCGACRQVLMEFCPPDTPVYVASAQDLDGFETIRLDDLLPHAFRFE